RITWIVLIQYKKEGDKMTVAVVMAGGRGERLWPLSRSYRPKQFVSWKGNSFFRATVDRITPVVGAENIYVVTQKKYKELALKQAPFIPPSNVIIEPQGKNTAPCIGLAAVIISTLKSPEEIMIVLPADHFIGDERTFQKLIRFACRLASDDFLVTLGITPLYPNTGYGYIHYGESHQKEGEMEAFKVLNFTEKPDLETARKYLKEGTYLWNSGIFVWKAKVILEEIEKYMPDLYRGLMKIKEKIGTPQEKEVASKVFKNLESISIDYGVMEKTDRALVIPADMKWSDVGSWVALEEILEKDEQGNVVLNKHLGIDTQNCIIWTRKPVVTLGVKNLVVVEADDVIFLMPKSHNQRVRSVIEALKRQEEFKKLL
ncbi:MAG: mannose-1-phosphate guanylyltransferase, partial [Atribacterota bacterium]|nr:mannose-1-phosphate guanylyltransferase [Atribacterota bacterium]